jgi:hypothetical protein
MKLWYADLGIISIGVQNGGPEWLIHHGLQCLDRKHRCFYRRDRESTPAERALKGLLCPALTQPQIRFVQEYAMDRNATRSAIAAGFSRRTAGSQGSRLLTSAPPS